MERKGQNWTPFISHSATTPNRLAMLDALAILALASGPIEDCRFNGVPLFGEVQVVDSFPDFKIQVVDSFPDLKVKPVQHFADSCGEWEFVDSFPDFTVQFVDSFPDFKIEFVEHFPGEP